MTARISEVSSGLASTRRWVLARVSTRWGGTQPVMNTAQIARRPGAVKKGSSPYGGELDRQPFVKAIEPQPPRRIIAAQCLWTESSCGAEP